MSAQVYVKAIKKLEEVKAMLQAEMEQSSSSLLDRMDDIDRLQSSLLWNLFLASQQRYTLEEVLKLPD
ncbi:MAG: hypothetical protein KIG68_00030 [Oxalobacter sp.]|nr:hypothetical protein [Oxalobacter sp.]